MSRYIDADVRVGVPIKEAVIIEKTELTDECIDKIAEAVVQKLADRKTEPQTDIEITRAIVHKAIDDTAIAEDAYPDLRQKMHDAVDNYEPQTDCAWQNDEHIPTELASTMLKNRFKEQNDG